MLFRKGFWIARRLERFHGQDGRRRVVTVRVAGHRRKAGDDDVGMKRADDPHDVGHDALLVPEVKRFAVILGKPKINRP